MSEIETRAARWIAAVRAPGAGLVVEEVADVLHTLLAEVTRLKAENAALRAESQHLIARLAKAL